MNERCERCRFWKVDEEGPTGDEFGECHRHAPQPFRMTEEENLAACKGERPQEVFDWPVTHKDAWCGEFQPKQANVPTGAELSLLKEKKK